MLKLIGASREAIDKAEDRELFDKTMKGIGIETLDLELRTQWKKPYLFKRVWDFLVLFVLHLL